MKKNFFPSLKSQKKGEGVGSGSAPKCRGSTTLLNSLVTYKRSKSDLHRQTTIMNILTQVKVEALKLVEVVLTTWHSLTNSADLFSVEDLARRLHLELSRASIYIIYQATSNKKLGSFLLLKSSSLKNFPIAIFRC
jgi:hypothetical protein